MSFLETRALVKQFSGHLALDHVSIDVPENSIFGLLGPNGAGKTTLIRIINRITAPDSGEVLFNGQLSSPDDIYRIGYLPEERGLYKKMKVGEQALYLARLKGLSTTEATNRLKKWFERFEIMTWWNRRLEELSKGMQQKIQFIITVVHNPDLLIFDEPFSGFDPMNAELLKKEILTQKHKGKTIIFSTHNMASVEEICDEIALLDHSRVVLSGNVGEIRNRFKHNIFRITSAKESIYVDSSIGSIVERTRKNNAFIFKLKIHEENCNRSQFLSNIVKNNEIISFEEEIPSMNDIFIQTVKQNKDYI